MHARIAVHGTLERVRICGTLRAIRAIVKVVAVIVMLPSRTLGAHVLVPRHAVVSRVTAEAFVVAGRRIRVVVVKPGEAVAEFLTACTWCIRRHIRTALPARCLGGGVSEGADRALQTGTAAGYVVVFASRTLGASSALICSFNLADVGLELGVVANPGSIFAKCSSRADMAGIISVGDRDVPAAHFTEIQRGVEFRRVIL
tara:strand:+ start:3507 stop:4109 length:603 start_codon:yes stop_codon:yes gene_type:complete